MKTHPLADIFPPIDGAAFDELVADIRAHGVREPIWTYRGLILDGRHRERACDVLGIVCPAREYQGDDPAAFVISVNLHRRHLSESERAMVGAKLANLERGDNQHAPDGATSQAKAAGLLHVGRRSIQRAREVLEKGSEELQKAVTAGRLKVATAARVVDLPKSKQLQAATKKAEPEPPPPEFSEDWQPDPSWAEQEEAAHQEYLAAIAKVMDADDKLAAAHDVIKRQAAEIASLKISRDGFMNGKGVVLNMLKAEQRKVTRLEAALKKQGRAA